MQQRAAPFDMEKIQSVAGASVARGAHRVSQDRIVYTPANVHIEEMTYNLDLNNDQITDFVIAELNLSRPACQGHTDYYEKLSLTGQGSNGVEVSSGYAARLASGSPIGPGQSFSPGSWQMEYIYDYWSSNSSSDCDEFHGENGNWPLNTGGYLGLALVIRGKTHYGWAALGFSRYPNFHATLTGYAYQTRAGKSINAGQM